MAAKRREPALPSPTAQRMSEAATSAEVASRIRRKVAFIEEHGTPGEIARMNQGISALFGLIRAGLAGAHPGYSDAELFCLAELIRLSRSFERRAANQLLRGLASVMRETHPAASRALLLALPPRNREARLDLIEIGEFEASMSKSERTKYRGLTSDADMEGGKLS
ncbi:MAG: hypothetical protein ACR2NX_14530 [Chthoniobacterales bacterium]